MSTIKAALLLLLITLASSVVLQTSSPSVDSQYVPIPKRYPGLSTGASDGPITIELVYDPTCDGSAALDQTIRSVVSGLDQSTLSKISFKFAINILPYHITSEKIAMAVRYVADNQGADEGLRVLRFFLDNIDRWNEQSIRKVTINDFLNNLAGQVAALTGLTRSDIRAELAHGSNTDRLTRQWSKYVMGSLRLPGTPFLQINGARVDGAGDLGADKLTALIKSLV